MNEQLKHAWHHVVGISSEEMKQAAAEAEKRYGDIIMLPRPVSRTHPPLSREQKAAQYSPFAALTGYDDAIEETGRLTQERIVLDEDKKAELNRKLEEIRQDISSQPSASFTYFVPDSSKEGGEYVTAFGQVRKIDLYLRKIILTDGREILVDDLFDIS